MRSFGEHYGAAWNRARPNAGVWLEHSRPAYQNQVEREVASSLHTNTPLLFKEYWFHHNSSAKLETRSHHNYRKNSYYTSTALSTLHPERHFLLCSTTLLHQWHNSSVHFQAYLSANSMLLEANVGIIILANLLWLVLEARLEQANLLKKVYSQSVSVVFIPCTYEMLGCWCDQRPCTGMQLWLQWLWDCTASHG
jgi:hypothetical protein